ncbi:hypothetical protein DSC91_004350 [Paraburkholderia caffeinilytica]|jgi:hypothetical protein|uniref:Secreted protein n=1 Tax=Paraburkholderia caffeinilytica TaxID=1761016 RepID=A0ABQ1L5V1_9BURK|nr:hypothetical protein [Paraburkholderia caffeinilytica]AXL51612.1 hypothetical protein DSC91_004350 [Paraburkholderia caffeinilytica]GGC19390.1 hypothetical protein GCM10011400_02210 [Paraburkholderia caffeinilytica]CAB3808278.1 hypothetical protein LMG28690_07016 [Paraburkholderia caffeinilytica]
MNASTQKPSGRRPCAALLSALLGVLAAGAVTSAAAQQLTQPGNLVVERDITPRDAFVPVPKSQDPIAVQVQTFPRQTFDAAIGTMASDLDLNGAHGTTGISSNGFMPSLVGANGIEHMLAGNNNVPVGAVASFGGAGGIGSSVAQSVSSALAPLGAALGAMK